MKTKHEIVRYIEQESRRWIGVKPRKPAGVPRATWRAAEQSRLREGRRRARASRWRSRCHGVWVLDGAPGHEPTGIFTVSGGFLGTFGGKHATLSAAMAEERRRASP